MKVADISGTKENITERYIYSWTNVLTVREVWMA
jgi:hypothetical protein